ncbi:MAG TPA: prepilin peptidase [Candidatus Saccharimonadales bacterium]|nr:prepilin peptidase [Candidatus Saccharimonadales bacterium]
MIIVILAVVGLCLGSFVNALVWRVHEQAEQAKTKKKPDKAYAKRLSIATGKSMCPHCHHELVAKDLVPLLSWLSLGGKCRYCGRPIAKQYPLVELATALLFIASYVWWPAALHGFEIGVFVWWLILLVGLMALTVYDLRWFLLPNRILYPAGVAAFVMMLISIINADSPLKALLNAVLAVAIGGGIFYALFQFSEGKWIGGGDVKLGWLLGLVAGTPGRSVLFIFLASFLGTLVSLSLLKSQRLSKNSLIPFGPFLIAGLIITQLFGADILHWYQHTVIHY